MMNQANPNQLFLGTYRLYRTDNAKADQRRGRPLGRHQPRPHVGLHRRRAERRPRLLRSARSACRAAATASTPAPSKAGSSTARTRVTSLDADAGRESARTTSRTAPSATSRSTGRTTGSPTPAFNGFNAATPGQPGHVFKTTDAGKHWKDISSNLPDAPVNSLQLDASYPNTIYAGTDVGPFVTYNGGKSWQAAGHRLPDRRDLAAQPRPGQPQPRAPAPTDAAPGPCTTPPTVPALVVSKADTGVPVGPGSQIDYTITVRNIGNADATGVTITDPIPANTTFTQRRRRWHARPWQGQGHVERADHRGRRQRRRSTSR